MALQTVNFIDGHQTRRAQFAAPKRLLHSTALALVMAAMPMSLSAQVIWDGSSDTNWDDGTNWVGDAAPGGGDTAEFSDNTAVNQPTLNSDQSVAATTISTGILTIPNHLTSPTVAISGTGTVTVDTASGILTSATGVTITDSGTFNLVNSSTLQGSATLSAGSSATFTLNGGLVTNDLTINGGTANLTSGVVSGTTSVAAPVSVTNNATLSAVSNAGTFVNASTAGAVTNSGDGTNDGTIASLSNTGGTFLNNDTITGGVDVSAGTVTNAATGAMNGGALVSGGALENAGQIAGDVSVTGGAFTLSDGSSVTVGAASGDVTIGNDSGAATFVATGTSSIAGAFSVGAQGTATVGDSVTPVATALTVSGTTDVTGAGGNAAALSVVGGATFNTGNVTVGSDGTLTVGDADALTLENMNVGGGSGTTDVSAGGTLDVREGATLASAVTSASAVTNAGTINGTLGLSGAGSLLQSTSGVVTGTATLASGTQITSDGSLADVSNSGTFVNQSNGQAGTVTNQGLGSGSNAGTLGALIHNSSNSFANTGDITGAVSVSNGTVTNTGTMDAGASVTGGTLTNSGQVAGDVSVTGGDFNLSGGTVVDGSGAGAGPGDVTIGDDTGAAGFLATGTSSIAGAFSVGAQGTAIVGNTDATPDQLTVSGTTDVTGAGGNAAALSVVGGATFNTGNVTVGSDGTLTVGDADALTLENMNVGGGSGTTDVSAGGTLDVREGATLASAVTSASAVTNAGTINGTLGLSGAGSLLQSTSGVVTGTATLASGTQITSDGSLADVLNSGTFVNQSNGQAGTVTNQGLGTGSNAGTLGALIHNSSNSFANTGDITGAVSVSNGTVTNTGTMDAGASVTGGTLTNSGQVAGDVSVTGGDFNLSGGTVVDGSGAGAGPGDVTIGDDTGAAGFLATGTSSIAGAFSVGAQGTAIVGNTDATPDQLTVSGTTDVTGAGGNAAALSVVGGATFNTGNVTVGSDGTLTVGDADALTLENMNVGGGSGTMDVSAGGTLDVREGATLASAVTSAGTVTNAGAITGSVGVSAGTVTNAATGAMNGGALVSGGALDNAGQIAGDVSVTGGSFTLSDGSSVTVGAASGDVTIDGVGTQFDTTGTSSIAGDFALLNGGQATIGDGVIATVLTVSGAGGTTVDGTSSLTVTSNATLLSAISNTGTINFENSALVTGSITGAGLLNVSGDATVDGSISSANTISLANGTTGQTFSVTGDLVGVSNTVLAFDVDLADGAADIDLIDVTGEVSGSFLLSFADATSANADLPASDLTFLLWGSENAASFTYDFTDLTQNNPSYDYTVVPESGGSGLALHVAIDQDVGALAGSVALSQSLIGALVNRPTSPFTVGRAIPEEKNCAPGGWGRVTGGNVDASGDTTDSGGMQNGSNVTATYTGVQLGGDLSCFNGSIGGWDMAFGGFLGFNRGSGTISTISVANSTATSSPTANDFQQSYGGVYMTASKGNLVADLQVRTEKTDFTLNNASIAGTALSDATFASRATTVSGSVSASFPLKETGWNLVPTAGFMLSRSKTDTITFDLRSGETQPATLQIDDHTTKLGFLGLSASKLRIAETGDSAKSYFITGTYYRDFSEDLASHYADPENAIQGSLASETLGSFGEISIGMSYLKVLQTNGHGLPAKQFNASVRLDGRFSGSMNSTALTAQARWQF